jgi:hypothetical protein
MRIKLPSLFVVMEDAVCCSVKDSGESKLMEGNREEFHYITPGAQSMDIRVSLWSLYFWDIEKVTMDMGRSGRGRDGMRKHEPASLTPLPLRLET